MTTQKKLYPEVGSRSLVETIRIERKGPKQGVLRMVELGTDEVSQRGLRNSIPYEFLKLMESNDLMNCFLQSGS